YGRRASRGPRGASWLADSTDSDFLELIEHDAVGPNRLPNRCQLDRATTVRAVEQRGVDPLAPPSATVLRTVAKTVQARRQRLDGLDGVTISGLPINHEQRRSGLSQSANMPQTRSQMLELIIRFAKLLEC